MFLLMFSSRNMFIEHVHETCSGSMDILRQDGNEEGESSMDMKHGDKDMQHGHEAWTRSTGMRNGPTKLTCCMDKQYGHAEFYF